MAKPIQDRVQLQADELVAHVWNPLHKLSLSYEHLNGHVQTLQRELYIKPPGAAVLLYNPVKDTVVLVRQFRCPLFYLGEDPLLIEACAGLLDGEHPEEAIKREILEETGYGIQDVTFVMKVFTSPGVTTEYLLLYIAHIDDSQKQGQGGGLVEEGEEIEVLELPLAECARKLAAGELQDAKTVILLQHLLIKQTTRSENEKNR